MNAQVEKMTSRNWLMTQYIYCTLKLIIPLERICAGQGRCRHNEPLSEDIRDRICKNSGTVPCYAYEGGYSCLKQDMDTIANHAMANKTGFSPCDVQGLLDLRYFYRDGEYYLSMKDRMPWRMSKVQQLIDAFSLEGIEVKICDNAVRLEVP